MLNVMRENLRHLKWLLIVVAAALVLSMGLFFSGSSRSVKGVSADWAAQINGTPIASREFLSIAGNQDRYYRQLLGDQYSQLKPSLQLGSSVMRRLVSQEIMVQEAQKLGLSATPAEIADIIVNNPDLQDENGAFVGTEEYKRRYNRGYPGGVAAFEGRLAREIVIRKWTNLLTSSIDVTEAEIEETYRKRNEKTAIDYFLLPKSEQDISTQVSEEDLASWYDDHQDDYMKDERRTFRYMVVDRAALRETVEITDEDIAAYYQENESAYSHPEQRRASHILFRVQPDMTENERKLVRKQAESVHRRLAAGESMEPLARAMSQDPGSKDVGGDLGWFGRGRMMPPFEEASFNTPVGELAPVTETDVGFHVILVTDSRPAGIAPLDDVKDDIRNTLSFRRAHELVRSEADRILALLEPAEGFADVAAAEGLEILEKTVTRSDRLVDLAPGPEFLDALFEQETGTVGGPFTVAAGLALTVLDAIIPESVAPLEEVESEVRSAVLDARMAEAAVETGRVALQRNRSFDALARSLGKDKESSGDLAPGQIVLPATGGHSAELASALFAAETVEGSRGVVSVPSGALVYEVTRRVPFDPQAYQAGREDLGKELLIDKRARLLDQILQRLWDRYDIVLNEPLIEQADG